MIITSTTDSIDIVLGANVTTNQLHINASYNRTSATAVTPVKTSTVTNNTSAVSIVSSPSSGNQHQLRYCNIFNADSAQATVTIRINYNGTTRNVISITLQVNEYLQYTHRTGWKVFDINGGLKNINYNEAITEGFIPDFSLTANTATAFSLSTTTYCYYMGKATGAYKTITIGNTLTTAMATPTWAEMAIYKGTPVLGSTPASLTRCGFTDMSTFWLRTTTNMGMIVNTTNINYGDDLWLVIGNSAVTSAAFRVNTIADDIGAGFVLTAASSRPSLSGSLSSANLTVGTSNNTNMRFNWFGI